MITMIHTAALRLLTRSTPARESGERGQVLVIVAAGLIAMVGMVGLVIDVGNAWGQQRDSQNASDSASEAGALLLAQNLPFLAADPPQAVPNTNSDVAAAVIAALDANGVDIEEAWYTNFTGVRVG